MKATPERGIFLRKKNRGKGRRKGETVGDPTAVFER